MNIKKIIVDEKPVFCGDCDFCLQFFDDEHEEYYYKCIAKNENIIDPDEKVCNIFEERSE